MLKTLTYFIIFWYLFSQTSFAQESKQGHYFVASGLTNTKQHTEKFAYGLGFTYNFNEKIDILGLGLRHKTKTNKGQRLFAYGLENSDTQRLGIKYPFYLRLSQVLQAKSFQYEIFFSQRYYPEFYKGEPLTLSAFGGHFLYLFNQHFRLETGTEYNYNLNGREHRDLFNFFVASQQIFLNQYTIRFEYSKNFRHHTFPHIPDWLTLVTLGVLL